MNQIPTLYMGDLAAAVTENDDGIKYIALKESHVAEDDDIPEFCMDEIEARALHEWLGRALMKEVK